MNRRRFLSISAAMVAAPAWAATQTWQGRAFGADVSLSIKGGTTEILDQVPLLLAKIERLFSLYDPKSTLSNLNSHGVLHHPDPQFISLMEAASVGHTLTRGLFDPTVQPLWQAIASGGDIKSASQSIGWERVQFDANTVTLDQRQALTFNGIAQGFATDLMTQQLTALGFTETLVNIGEYRALGGPWTLGLHDPNHGQLGQRTLRGNAIATSSPAAMSLGDFAHILHPDGTPQWSTVSVEATTATLADCLSTALCLAPRALAEELRHADGVQRITLVDFDGNLISL